MLLTKMIFKKVIILGTKWTLKGYCVIFDCVMYKLIFKRSLFLVSCDKLIWLCEVIVLR